MMKLVRKVEIPAIVSIVIEKFYSFTRANIFVKDFISNEIEIESGVKQRCPESALLLKFN